MRILIPVILSLLVGCASKQSVDVSKETIKLRIEQPQPVNLAPLKDISAVAVVSDDKVCLSTDAYLKQIGLVDQLTARVLILQKNLELYKRYYEKNQKN